MLTRTDAKDLRYQGQGVDLRPEAKESRSHKANVQRQYLKVKDDNDH